ncbi:MAG: helix-turn-helix transcriptional regulator [Balneolaceae bacterium]
MAKLNSSQRRMKMILMLQQSTKRVTASDMAEKFGVSRRTIFRDIRVLEDLNVPLTWDEESGYGVTHGYKVPPLMFTTRELATILVGLNFVKSQVDKQLASDAGGVELKIKQVLPDELKRFMQALEDKTVVDPFLKFGLEKKEGGNWYLLSTAISEQRVVEFQYKSRDGETTKGREVEPYLLVFYRDHWNVIGFSRKRDDIRNFVLDSMSDVQLTDKKFMPIGEINAEALIFRSNESGQKVEVHIDKSIEDAFKANLPTKIIKREEVRDKKIKVCFRFDNLDYLNRWLLQFGEFHEIIKPNRLIKKRKSLLNKLLK